MLVLLKLQNGYGDGYGIADANEDGRPVVEPGRDAKYYRDEAGNEIKNMPLPGAVRNLLAQPAVVLVDGPAPVKVPTNAVIRVIGPLDCDEAVRVRFRRSLNYCDGHKEILERASMDEMRALMQAPQADYLNAFLALRETCIARSRA